MSAKILSSALSGTPTIHVAKKQLAYPLYSAEFDPLNPHFLLVGGGGGSSSTGVPNRITLLDASNRTEIKEISDIELSPEEDSVSSLAIADSSPESLLAYAGINSSPKDQAAGKNEHFRSFRVPLPAKRKKDGGELAAPLAAVGATKALGKTQIFRANGPKSEAYQRVLRLSPPVVEDGEKGSRLKKRMVTIATGLAKHNEVITFPAEEAPSATTKLISRINLEEKEANDVDLCYTETGTAMAYATDHAVYVQQLGAQKTATNAEPRVVYETLSGPKGRSKIRAMRFVGTRHIMTLQNRVDSGAELVLVKLSKDFTVGQAVLWKVLKNVKKAVGLDVCSLTADKDGSQQHLIAVAGQDSSLQIHALNYIASEGMTGFTQYADVVDVHNGPITKVAWSNYIGPDLPVSKNTPAQYARLVTVGVDKNVLIMTFPLQPLPATGSGKTSPRYVLIAPRNMQAVLEAATWSLIVALVVLSVLFTYLELIGAVPPIFGTSKLLPQRWRSQYSPHHVPPGPVIPESLPEISRVIDQIKLSEATPLIEKIEEIQDSIKLADASSAIESLQNMASQAPSSISSGLSEAPSSISSVIAEAPSSISSIASQAASQIPSTDDVQQKIIDLVGLQEKNRAVIVRDLEHLGGDVSAELQHEADIVREGTLKKWESLTKVEQKAWKRKMKEAGQWTEKQGEAVLKGVFFGQLGAIVGGIVHG